MIEKSRNSLFCIR